MKIVCVENYEELSLQAAQIIAKAVSDNSAAGAVLGLATGTSPVGAYKCLIDMCKKGEISFANVKSVNLDEYVGLGEESSESYVWFMNHNLFDGIDIDKRNTFLPNGKAVDLDAECKRYGALVRSLKQDVQVLGIGSNGHIGFNEPNTPFDSSVHIVSLAESTIKDNARLFASPFDVPTKAITMGISEIMQAKKVLMLAYGEHKAKAVRAMVQGEVSEACPASVLQHHPDVVLVVDKAAASLLDKEI